MKQDRSGAYNCAVDALRIGESLIKIGCASEDMRDAYEYLQKCLKEYEKKQENNQ